MRKILFGILSLLVSAPFSLALQGGTIQVVGDLPAGAKLMRQEFSDQARMIRLQGVLFSSKQATLQVVVNPLTSKSQWWELLAYRKCFAGTNGGYFHSDYQPLGLVISGGKQLHAQEQARLLSGIIAVGAHGIVLMRSNEPKPKGTTDALQSGPFLVDGGKVVLGLEATKTARRTFLATDGRQHWFLGVLSHCTLAEAAQVIVKSQIFGSGTVTRALNLDGGSSTGLWARPQHGEDFLLMPRSTVSNFLGIMPK